MSFCNVLQKLIKNGWSNTSSGLLKYSDNDINDISLINIKGNQLARNNIIVNMKIENISNVKKDMTSEIELYDNTKKTLENLLIDNDTPYLENRGVRNYDRGKLSRKLAKNVPSIL